MAYVSVEIVSIQLEPSGQSQLASIFKNDPQWDEFQAAMNSYRQQLDAELEAEHLLIEE